MTSTTNRHPPTKRIAVAELMRETDLTAEAIAVKTGVPYATVCRWNQFHNWRPWFRRTPPAVDPRRWGKPRLAALERVYRLPGVDPGDLAQAVGTDRTRARAFFRECGFAERPAPPSGEALDGQSLRRSLRGHLVRQIADLDAELSAHRGSSGDSARMLRDLTMLKKLVDEIEPAAEAGDDASEPDEQSLDALRASIWNRYVAFARQRIGHDAPEEEIAAAAEAVFEQRLARYAPSAYRPAEADSP